MDNRSIVGNLQAALEKLEQLELKDGNIPFIVQLETIYSLNRLRILFRKSIIDIEQGIAADSALSYIQEFLQNRHTQINPCVSYRISYDENSKTYKPFPSIFDQYIQALSDFIAPLEDVKNDEQVIDNYASYLFENLLASPEICLFHEKYIQGGAAPDAIAILKPYLNTPFRLAKYMSKQIACKDWTEKKRNHNWEKFLNYFSFEELQYVFFKSPDYLNHPTDSLVMEKSDIYRILYAEESYGEGGHAAQDPLFCRAILYCMTEMLLRKFATKGFYDKAGAFISGQVSIDDKITALNLIKKSLLADHEARVKRKYIIEKKETIENGEIKVIDVYKTNGREAQEQGKWVAEQIAAGVKISQVKYILENDYLRLQQWAEHSKLNAKVWQHPDIAAIVSAYRGVRPKQVIRPYFANRQAFVNDVISHFEPNDWHRISYYYNKSYLMHSLQMDINSLSKYLKKPEIYSFDNERYNQFIIYCCNELYRMEKPDKKCETVNFVCRYIEENKPLNLFTHFADMSCEPILENMSSGTYAAIGDAIFNIEGRQLEGLSRQFSQTINFWSIQSPRIFLEERMLSEPSSEWPEIFATISDNCLQRLFSNVQIENLLDNKIDQYQLYNRAIFYIYNEMHWRKRRLENTVGAVSTGVPFFSAKLVYSRSDKKRAYEFLRDFLSSGESLYQLKNNIENMSDKTTQAALNNGTFDTLVSLIYKNYPTPKNIKKDAQPKSEKSLVSSLMSYIPVKKIF